MFEFMFELLF